MHVRRLASPSVVPVKVSEMQPISCTALTTAGCFLPRKKAKLGHAYKEEPFQVWLLEKKKERILFKFLVLIVQVKET